MTILALSPHPDDTEYSISGTILKYSLPCTIVCFTVGTKGDHSIERVHEVKEFWRGVDDIVIYHDRNTETELVNLSERYWIQSIEHLLNVGDYSTLLIPPHDDTHFEHRFVHNIGMALARTSRVDIAEYKTVSATNDWIPNVFVDISGQYLNKLSRLARIKSQYHHNYFDREFLDGFHFSPQAGKCGMLITEQYKLLRGLSL